MSMEVKAVIMVPHEPQPAVDWVAYLRERRRALLQEVKAIEDVLGEGPTVRAVCPSCARTWNQKKVG